MVLKAFSFCLFVKFFISSSTLNNNIAICTILDYRFFYLITLNILCHSLLACKASCEKSAESRMGFPLLVTAFLILFLNISFYLLLLFFSPILIIVYISVDLFGLIFFGTSCIPEPGYMFLFPI